MSFYIDPILIFSYFFFKKGYNLKIKNSNFGKIKDVLLFVVI